MGVFSGTPVPVVPPVPLAAPPTPAPPLPLTVLDFDPPVPEVSGSELHAVTKRPTRTGTKARFIGPGYANPLRFGDDPGDPRSTRRSLRGPGLLRWQHLRLLGQVAHAHPAERRDVLRHQLDRDAVAARGPPLPDLRHHPHERVGVDRRGPRV